MSAAGSSSSSGRGDRSDRPARDGDRSRSDRSGGGRGSRDDRPGGRSGSGSKRSDGRTGGSSARGSGGKGSARRDDDRRGGSGGKGSGGKGSGGKGSDRRGSRRDDDRRGGSGGRATGGRGSGGSGAGRRDEVERRDWGSVARHGARKVSEESRGPIPPARPLAGPPAPRDDDEWVRVADGAPPARPRRRRQRARVDITLDEGQLGGLRAAQRKRLVARLGEAAADYEAERYGDARSTLAPLARRHPQVAELRELYGLVLYRLGRWSQAEAELAAFSDMTGATEQHPVRMDCARALGRTDELARLWEELRESSPSAALVTEGRIVVASAMADEGRLGDAIAELEAGPVRTKRPRDHHLRLWYALADLYEQTGDLPRARRGFERVAGVEPGFADVGERLGALD